MLPSSSTKPDFPNLWVVDDDKAICALLESYVLETEFLILKGVFNSAIPAVGFLNREEVDLVFSDVEMPGMTGIEFVQSLQTKPLFIFISGREKYAIEAFECQVVDYLLKPFGYARFLKSALKAQEIFKSQYGHKDTQEIFVKVEERFIKLDVKTILWVEALGNYVVIQTLKDRYVIHTTMKGMEEKLPREAFIRVHRSFLVRIDRIEEMDEHVVVVQKKVIPVGRSYKKNLILTLNIV